MKYYLIAPALVTFLASGCVDDNGVSPDNRAHDTFRKMFPDVTAVEWEQENSYYVADFKVGNNDKEAWFDGAGEWKLTETELPYADLPEAVRLAHEAGIYKDWTKDDVDFVERQGREAIYVLEVKSGSLEYDLYYVADGTLIKAFPDDDDNNDYLPVALPNKVSQFLGERYPEHKLIDTDEDDGRFEVEFIDGKFKREADFTKEGEWIRTETEVELNDVADDVKEVLTASEYREYSVDDIDFIETPEGYYYYFELELGSSDVDIIIRENGDLEVVK